MDDDDGDKSEEPSQRRRDEARDEGRVAFSNDLNGSLLLLAGVMIIWLTGEGLAMNLRATMRMHFLRYLPERPELDSLGALVVIQRAGIDILQTIGLFLALIFALAIGISLSQAGIQFSPGALGPKFDKLNPITGLQRIFSTTGLVKALISILKVLVVLGVVVWMLWGQGPRIAALGEGSLAHTVSSTWDLAIKLLLAIAAALVVLGVADYAFQKYQFEQSLRMTRQQVKEEHKSEEGDPQIRARRRAIAREIARRERMLQQVPEATVVVTNPTHFAIALRYKRDESSAPIVVAKGKDGVAQRIVALARRHNVPILERKAVAQALYHGVKVGEEIPAEMYHAVSEVIAYVFRLRGAA